MLSSNKSEVEASNVQFADVSRFDAVCYCADLFKFDSFWIDLMEAP